MIRLKNNSFSATIRNTNFIHSQRGDGCYELRETNLAEGIEEGAEVIAIEDNNKGPCARCNGLGYAVDSSQAVVFAEPCRECLCFDAPWSEQERRNKAAERISGANIPSVLAIGLGITIQHSELQRWIEATLSGSLRRDLFLWGPPGTGKSVLAVAVMAAFLKAERQVFYLDAANYVRDVRKGHNAKYVNRIGDHVAAMTHEIQRRLKGFDLVVLDNLGRGNTVTDFTVDQYSELVERRHDTGRRTIYISNYAQSPVDSLDGRELATKIGPVAAQRVCAAACLQIGFRQDQAPRPETNDFRIINFRTRSLAQDDGTLLHAWARLGLFRLISHQERSKLTRPSVIDPNEIVEVPAVREFVGWGGYHVIQTGAVVDQYDCAVLIAILKLYHRRGENGRVIFSLGELADTLGIKSAGAGAINKALKRSLNRLVESKVRIRASNHGKLFWAGG